MCNEKLLLYWCDTGALARLQACHMIASGENQEMMGCLEWQERSRPHRLFSTMSLYKNSSFLVLLVLNIYAVVSGGGVNLTVSDSADKPKQSPSLSPPAAAAVVNSPVFKPAVDSLFSLNLLSSFPEDLEITDYCSDLLHIFGQRYVAYVNCLVPAARPVKVCQNCFSSYGSLMDIYTNISSDQVPNTTVIFCVLVCSELSPVWRGQALSMRSCLMITSLVMWLTDWWWHICGNTNFQLSFFIYLSDLLNCNTYNTCRCWVMKCACLSADGSW